MEFHLVYVSAFEIARCLDSFVDGDLTATKHVS